MNRLGRHDAAVSGIGRVAWVRRLFELEHPELQQLVLLAELRQLGDKASLTLLRVTQLLAQCASASRAAPRL